MGWSDEDAIEERIALIELLEQAQDEDRSALDRAGASGRRWRARRIQRRMLKRQQRIASA